MSNNILLVKLSSMGDVVHSFPALAEAARHGHRFDWVVEEAFVDLAAMHPAVDKVLPFGLRRWRKQPFKGVRELSRFVSALRANRYQHVLDAQGLLKSALLTRASGAAHRMGLAAGSARESASARFYTARLDVSWELHAIDRLRLLFSLALGYSIDLARPAPSAFAASGAAADSAGRTVLIHGTTWRSKEYPETGWRLLIERLRSAGHSVAVVSGSSGEYERALRLCSIVTRDTPGGEAVALPPGTLLQAAEHVRGAGLVIGVDSGLTHLAAVLGRPTVGLFGPTSAARTGVRGLRALDLVSDFQCAPCMQRECSYRGVQQKFGDDAVEPACFSRLTAERIVAAANSLTVDSPEIVR